MRHLLIVTLLLGFASMSALQESFAEVLTQLRAELETRGVPTEWFDANVRDERFQLHREIEDKFTGSAEHKVDRSEEKTLEWYFNYFGVDAKVRLGRQFMAEHRDLMDDIEARFGIHAEMVCAVLGMETNFAQERYKGNYYVFNSLVSQYLFMERRRKFALNELDALYKFSEKAQTDSYEFIGSFAGASGWGQFIPSSMLNFFVDAGGEDADIDIYSLEDNAHSIANYLHAHGLNAQTMGDEKKRYSAVYAYNHSDAYVQAVLYIYTELRNK